MQLSYHVSKQSWSSFSNIILNLGEQELIKKFFISSYSIGSASKINQFYYLIIKSSDQNKIT